MQNEQYYTTGELASLAGITYKSIRVYVEKGLIVPDRMTDSGYKLFSRRSVERLQRILMFKYLDFSLEEIGQLLEEEDIKQSLDRQSELIESKITHLNQIQNAVNEMKALPEDNNWEKMLEIMKLTSRKEEIINQYVKIDNLEKRINIHEYSTSDVDWYDYLMEKCDIKEGMNILDIGCGNGQLWYKEKDNLPKNINIYLIDNSSAMIQAAKNTILCEQEYYKKKKINFHYIVCDAQKVGEVPELNLKKYDLIMANHMLYHIEDLHRKRLLASLAKILADGGKFIASTIGEGHMKELWDLATLYDKKVKVTEWFSSGFSLENGKEQLEEFFGNVTVHYDDNNLLVDDWRVIYDYMCSLPGGIEKIMKQSEEASKRFLKSKVTDRTPYFIRKNTGVFVAERKKDNV